MIKQQILILGVDVELIKPEDTKSSILDKYGRHYVAMYDTLNVKDMKYRIEGNHLEIYDTQGVLRRIHYRVVNVSIGVLTEYEVNTDYDSVTILPDETESASLLFRNKN